MDSIFESPFEIGLTLGVFAEGRAKLRLIPKLYRSPSTHFDERACPLRAHPAIPNSKSRKH